MGSAQFSSIEMTRSDCSWTQSWMMLTEGTGLISRETAQIEGDDDRINFIFYFFFLKPPVGTTLYGIEAFRTLRFLLSSPDNTLFLNLLLKDKSSHLTSLLSPPSRTLSSLSLHDSLEASQSLCSPRPSRLRKPFQVISLSLSHSISRMLRNSRQVLRPNR